MNKAPVTYYVTKPWMVDGRIVRNSFAVAMQNGRTLETGSREQIEKLYPDAIFIYWCDEMRDWRPMV